MRRTFVELCCLCGLLGAPACLDDEGPDEFTTEGTCIAGDRESCDCDSRGTPGTQLCTSEGRFGVCRCNGCSVTPDCAACSDGCLDQCLCNDPSAERESRCAEECGPGTDAAPAGARESSTRGSGR